MSGVNIPLSIKCFKLTMKNVCENFYFVDVTEQN